MEGDDQKRISKKAVHLRDYQWRSVLQKLYNRDPQSYRDFVEILDEEAPTSVEARDFIYKYIESVKKLKPEWYKTDQLVNFKDIYEDFENEYNIKPCPQQFSRIFAKEFVEYRKHKNIRGNLVTLFQLKEL